MTNEGQATEVKKTEYKKFDELTQSELKKCDLVRVKIARIGTEGQFVRAEIIYDDKYTKQIPAKKFDMNDFHLVVSQRGLSGDEMEYVIVCPVRYFKGKTKENDDYFRYEVRLSKDKPVYDFFKSDDMVKLNAHNIIKDQNIKFKKDPNNEELLNVMADALEIDYTQFV